MGIMSRLQEEVDRSTEEHQETLQEKDQMIERVSQPRAGRSSLPHVIEPSLHRSDSLTGLYRSSFVRRKMLSASCRKNWKWVV